MYSLIRLNTFTATKYKVMTFPALQPLLENFVTNDSIVAIGAAYSEHPIGLALAKVGSDEQGEDSAEILSIFVAASHRCRGIGKALLTAMEDELYQRGCRKILLVYRTGKPTTPALECLLQQCQWSTPQTRLLMFQATPKRMMEAPWIHKVSLPTSFSIFLWTELTKTERMIIQHNQEIKQWYPESLSPFQDEEIIESSNSLGLRYKGEIVGWMITHRFAPDTIRYTALFVRQDFQKMGRAISLLAKAINLHNSSNIPEGLFVVDPENKFMLRFVNRHMAPYLTSTTETRGTYKSLGENKIEYFLK
jgi:GNAT superfamily N-acetyltransferase